MTGSEGLNCMAQVQVYEYYLGSICMLNMELYAWATSVGITTECVQCLTMRKAPPSARWAGGAAGSWTAWGPPAGLSRHNLAVHGTQQQHQTHGSKHLAGTCPGDLKVQQHRCHWGEQNILQQQTKWSLRGDIITEFMLTNEVSSALLRCDG